MTVSGGEHTALHAAQLPAVIVGETRDDAAVRRTRASLARQTVLVAPMRGESLALAASAEYVVFVCAGVELDATACERAVWHLATHPELACVTGAIAGQGAAAGLENVARFFVVRQQPESADGIKRTWPKVATAIDAAVALWRTGGNRVGWLLEPVDVSSASASAGRAIPPSARDSWLSAGMTDAELRFVQPTLSPFPVQRLAPVTVPALTVRPATCSGMRILALFQGFPMGGYTAFNADVLPRIAALGHRITTCTTEWWRSDWRLDRVRAASPDVHHACSVVPMPAVPAYIDWLIASRRIDVVLLSHTFLGLNLLAWLRARHPSVAFVDYVHTDWFEAWMYGSYATMAVQWESQLDAQLATSHALVEQLSAGGCEPASLRAAHIGIDADTWRHDGPRQPDVRESIGATQNTLVLIFSGRVSPEKRPLLAVDVAAQLHHEGHDVMLLFAGQGPLLQATRDHAAARGLGERCKFFGEVDEVTLRYLYAASDVFIAPSEIEGIARSLYEAMAMGCVPVVSDVGGQRELVVAGTGQLVAPDGVTAAPYVDGVRPYLDATARSKASVAARAHIVAHFSSRATVTAICDTLAFARERRRSRQSVLPPAIAEALAVQSIEIMRRHVLQRAPQHAAAAVSAEPPRARQLPPPTAPQALEQHAEHARTSPAASRPTILVIADVPNWIFERHARALQTLLSDEFDITIQYHTEAFDENAWDLIYVMEYGLVPSAHITMPWKYVTALRSHVSWTGVAVPELARYLRAHFQRTHVVSKRLRRELAPALLDVAYVTHGIDASRFRYVPRQSALDRPLRVGWAGNRQTAVKGFADFIEPIGQLAGVELVFCGYADRNRSLDEMPAWYADVDVYVCASLSEGSNNSLLEAAASGCAIITTDNGTVPEYLTDGESALVVPRVRDAFSAAVVRLRDDPTLRVRLGEAASAAVLPAWTWEVKREDHRAFFRAALAARDDARRAMVNATPGGRRWMTRQTDALQQAVRNGTLPEALSLLSTLLEVDPTNAGFLEIRTLLTAGRGRNAA